MSLLTLLSLLPSPLPRCHRPPPQVEMPIPEQFVSKISPDGKLTTTVSELYSS
jgi:hypothetical protein